MAAEEVLEKIESRMHKTLDVLHKELASIRTGRAHPSHLEHVKVDVYGQSMPLTNAASIAATDSKTLTVTVWDANNVKAVDSAIRQADLNLNPRIDGNKLFISIPGLTAERRQALMKIVKKKGEDAKIGVRNIRRDINDELKKLEKEKSISEDILKSCLEDSQKTTDKYIEEIDHSIDNKQKVLEII